MVAALKRFKDWLIRNIHWVIIGVAIMFSLFRRGSAGGLPNLNISKEREEMAARRAEKNQADAVLEQTQKAVDAIDARKAGLDKEAKDLDARFETSKATSAELKERSQALRERAKKAGLLGILIAALLLAYPGSVRAESPTLSFEELKTKYLEALDVIAEQDALLQAYEAENTKLITQCEEFKAQRDQYKALYEELRLKISELTSLAERYKMLYESAEAKAELYLGLYEELHKLYLRLAAPKLKLGTEAGYDGGFDWNVSLSFEIPFVLP